MKIKLVIIVVLITCFNNAYSQEQSEAEKKTKVPFKDRLFFSPDIGLQFGTVTIVNLSPKIGYRITDKLAAGLGATYIYLNDKRFKSYGYTLETNIYGGSVFTQYQLLEPVRLYAEYGMLDLETFDVNILKSKRELIPSLLVGGGYSQSMGGNSSLVILLLYDLIESPKSIYSNPVIRIGFNIGL